MLKKRIVMAVVVAFPFFGRAQTAQELIGIVHNSPRPDAEVALQDNFDRYFFGSNDDQTKMTKALKDFKRKYGESPLNCDRGVPAADAQELDRARGDAQRARNDLTQARTETEQARAALAQAQQQLQDAQRYRDEVARLQREMAILQEQIRGLQEALRNNGDVARQLAEALERIKRLEEQLAQAQRDAAGRSNAEQVCEELGRQNRTLREQNAKLQPENERLQKELLEARRGGGEQSTKQAAEIKRLQDELKAAQEQARLASDRAQRELDKQSKLIADMERQRGETQKEIDRLKKLPSADDAQRRVAELTKEIEILQRHLEKEKQNTEAAVDDLEKLGDENATLKERLKAQEEAVAQVARLQADNERLKKQIADQEELQQRNEELKQRNDDLAASQAGLRKKAEDAVKERDDLRMALQKEKQGREGAMNKLKDENAQLQELVKGLTKANKAKDVSLEEKGKTLQEHNANIERLNEKHQQELDSAKKQFVECDNKLTEIQSQQGDWEKEAGGEQERARKAAEENTALKQELADLKELRSTELDQAIEDMAKECKGRLDKAQNQVAQADAEKQAAENRNAQLAAKNKDLQDQLNARQRPVEPDFLSDHFRYSALMQDLTEGYMNHRKKMDQAYSDYAIKKITKEQLNQKIEELKKEDAELDDIRREAVKIEEKMRANSKKSS